MVQLSSFLFVACISTLAFAASGLASQNTTVSHVALYTLKTIKYDPRAVSPNRFGLFAVRQEPECPQAQKCSTGGCCTTGTSCCEDSAGCCPTDMYCTKDGCCPNGSVCGGLQQCATNPDQIQCATGDGCCPPDLFCDLGANGEHTCSNSTSPTTTGDQTSASTTAAVLSTTNSAEADTASRTKSSSTGSHQSSPTSSVPMVSASGRINPFNVNPFGAASHCAESIRLAFLGTAVGISAMLLC